MLRLSFLCVLGVAVCGCSSEIYRQTAIRGSEPIAISVDARQRILLSQQDPRVQAAAADPVFRRFCAEPSPDVFTVLGVGASGGASFSQDAKSLNAALQAAFSSSETGSTIARTQTVNMLREMMFRTCERYLSGAISRADFAIVAARDQRIMVSILAIEQLTGAITPPAVAISANGSSSTGLNPTEMVKLLATKQEELASAETAVTTANKTLSAADVAAATCETLSAKKAAGSPALTAEETTKLKACDDGKAALGKATAARDIAKAQYEDLVAASKKGIGVSAATSGGTVTFDDSAARKDAVVAVSNSVERIVANTFKQDETQLFCLRALTDPEIAKSLNAIQAQCLNYLTTKIATDERALAAQYGLPVSAVYAAKDAGAELQRIRSANGQAIQACLAKPALVSQVRQALMSTPSLKTIADAFVRAGQGSSSGFELYLYDLGNAVEQEAYAALGNVCGFGAPR